MSVTDYYYYTPKCYNKKHLTVTTNNTYYSINKTEL